MRGSIYAVVTLIAAAGWALPVAAQVEKNQTGTSLVSTQAQEKTPPYIAEYKTTYLLVLANGKTKTSEWTTLVSLDSEGRRLDARTDAPWRPVDTPVTHYHVYDPVAWTNTYWSVPGLHQAYEEKKLPSGSDRDPCPEAAILRERQAAQKAKNGASKQAQLNTIGLTQETPAQDQTVQKTAPRPKVDQHVHEDLGIKTIQGIEAQGIRDTATYAAGWMGNKTLSTFIMEFWLTSAPGIRGIPVLNITESPGRSKTTEELVKLTLGEPAMSFFQPPGGYEIVKGEEVRTECVNLQKLPPVPPPAQ
jgi:hypothetical protein